MIYLLFSILITTLLFVIFKYFGIFKIDTFQAIVVNYVVAFAFGLITSDVHFSMLKIATKPWFLGAVFLGILFITMFNVMALTAQKAGVTVVSVASKMSLVIPVVVGFVVFNEKPTFIKIIGVLAALFAVYFVSQKNEKSTFSKRDLIMPLTLFFGSGILDATLNYIQKIHVPKHEIALYSATIFLVAGMVGLLALTLQIAQKKANIKSKNLLAGIILGVPNFYSIYFLLKALDVAPIEKGILFTINNVAVVLLSTLVGLIIFNEKLLYKNYIGIALALLAILLVLI